MLIFLTEPFLSDLPLNTKDLELELENHQSDKLENGSQ